jgi:hypothetical protein
MEKVTAKRSRRRQIAASDHFIQSLDLAKLGDGEVAYIKEMSPDEVHRMFPTITGLPDDTNVFALHGADGTPIALTDSRQSAVGHAMGDKLVVASVH